MKNILFRLSRGSCTRYSCSATREPYPATRDWCSANFKFHFTPYGIPVKSPVLQENGKLIWISPTVLTFCRFYFAPTRYPTRKNAPLVIHIQTLLTIPLHFPSTLKWWEKTYPSINDVDYLDKIPDSVSLIHKENIVIVAWN